MHAFTHKNNTDPQATYSLTHERTWKSRICVWRKKMRYMRRHSTRLNIIYVSFAAAWLLLLLFFIFFFNLLLYWLTIASWCTHGRMELEMEYCCFTYCKKAYELLNIQQTFSKARQYTYERYECISFFVSSM